MILKVDNSVFVDGNNAFDVSQSAFGTTLEVPLQNTFTTSSRFVTIDYESNRMFVTLANTVNVFNATTLAYISTITQAGGSFNNPMGMCVDNANNRLLVCNNGNSTVSVINLTTLALISVITTAGGNFSGVISVVFDANFYYFLNRTSKNVVVLKRTDLSFDATILGTSGDFTSIQSNYLGIDIQAGIVYVPASQMILLLNTTTRQTTRVVIWGKDFKECCVDKVNNRLLVSDHVNNSVLSYNLSNFAENFSFVLQGSNTNNGGLTIDYPNSRIFYCQSALNKIEIIKFKN